MIFLVVKKGAIIYTITEIGCVKFEYGSSLIKKLVLLVYIHEGILVN